MRLLVLLLALAGVGALVYVMVVRKPAGVAADDNRSAPKRVLDDVKTKLDDAQKEADKKADEALDKLQKAAQ
jgi:hypothetical protein